MKTFVAVFNAFIITVLSFFAPSVPAPRTEDDLQGVSSLFEKYELADEIYVIDNNKLDSEEKVHMLICLQGIVAKTKPCIYLKRSSTDTYYLEKLKSYVNEVSYTDDNGNEWTLELLIEKFKSYIGDSGYVLYRKSDNAEGLNMATNLASLYGWLAVPESLEELAVNAGLTLKEDFSDDEYNNFFQWKFFLKHKDEFNNNAVVHEKYIMYGLRDLAIQQKFFTFFDDDAITDLLRVTVMNHAGDNVPLIGWANYEIAYVTSASKTGNFVIPADHCYNNSILINVPVSELNQKHKDTKEYTDPTKHYCAIVFSDGDNIQWIQNGFSEFYKKLSLATDFPMTWTVPPMLREFSPLTSQRIYASSTVNDYFIGGVSGAGYAHPSEYPHKALSGFTDMTASAMLKSDLEYVSILDSTPDNIFDEFNLSSSLEYYARYDNVKGGMLYLDPDRYFGGNGKIYFVNDKPFITTRYSLWHPSNDSASVNKEWLDEQINIVNNYKADFNSINGYSDVNIHPWSISIENLEYFVNGLSDDIVLVTFDELMTMINKNIPHETAEVDK